MADQLIQRAGETARWLERLPGSKQDAGRSIVWAAFNLRTARMGERIVAELGSGPAGVARLQAVFDEDWEILEIGAMSLAFEDVMSALDLCANAVYLVSGRAPSSDGRYKDLGWWKPERLSNLPSNTKDWLVAIQAHPDKHRLDHCRTELAHRASQRHVIRAADGASTPSLTEITIPGVGGDPPERVSIGVLIPRLVEFGKEQFLRCCAALESDF
jgi:hypothetical protein